MPSAYTLVLRREAVDVFRSLRGSERQQFERFFGALQDRPGQPADAFTRDELGRRLKIKYIGRFRVVYWIDHAGNEVKVVKLELLPRQ